VCLKNGLHCPIMAVSRGAMIDPVDGMGYPSFKFQGPESMIRNSVALCIPYQIFFGKAIYSVLLSAAQLIFMDRSGSTNPAGCRDFCDCREPRCRTRSRKSALKKINAINKYQKHVWQPQNRYSRKVGNQAILVLKITCTYLYHPGSCSILFGDPCKLKMCQNQPWGRPWRWEKGSLNASKSWIAWIYFGYNEIHNEDMNGYDITNGDVWMSG